LVQHFGFGTTKVTYGKTFLLFLFVRSYGCSLYGPLF